MSILKYFKNTPGRPHRATGPKCNFFLQICNEVLGKKKRPVAPSDNHWAQTGGPVAPPRATGVTPLYKIQPPFPPHLSPKIPPKIQKKRKR